MIEHHCTAFQSHFKLLDGCHGSVWTKDHSCWSAAVQESIHGTLQVLISSSWKSMLAFRYEVTNDIAHLVE